MADAFAIVPFDDSDDEGTVSMAHKGGGGGGAAVATRVTFRVAINPNAVRDREGEGVSIHGSIEVTHAPHSLMSFSACVIFRCSRLPCTLASLPRQQCSVTMHCQSRHMQHQHAPQGHSLRHPSPSSRCPSSRYFDTNIAWLNTPKYLLSRSPVAFSACSVAVLVLGGARYCVGLGCCVPLLL